MTRVVVTLAEQFLKEAAAQGYSRRTVETYRSTFRRFLVFLDAEGIETVDDVTHQTLARYQSQLVSARGPKGRPLSLGRQAQLVAELKVFFRSLVRKGHLLVDPTSRLDLPRIPRRPPAVVLNLASMKRLLLAPAVSTPLGVRDRAILELLYSTGLRVSELSGLDVYDVDLAAGELLVRRGKGGRSRQLPVGEAARQWVGRYLNDVRPKLTRRAAEVALFLTWRGRRIHRRDVCFMVHRYARAVGLSDRVTPHTVRHSFATHMLQGKASLRHLQEMLGHVKLTTTQIYTRVDITDLKAVHRRCHPRGRG